MENELVLNDISYFNYRSQDDSVLTHHTRTLFSEYTEEQKKRILESDYIHAHDRYEIIHLISGKVSYIVDGVSYQLNHGDVLIIPPGKIHKRNIVPVEDYERYSIEFHRNLISSPPIHLNNLLDELLIVGNDYLIHFPAETVKKYGLEKSIQRFENFQKYEHNKDIILISYILDLAIEINDAILKEQSSDKSDILSIDHPRSVLREIVNYVDQNLYSEIKLDDIASALYLNKYYLSHHFKEKMGVSLKKYVIMKKLFHADYLINNGKPPTEVARKLGYENYSTFYYAYKRQFGREPSKLRPYVEDYGRKDKKKDEE